MNKTGLSMNVLVTLIIVVLAVGILFAANAPKILKAGESILELKCATTGETPLHYEKKIKELLNEDKIDLALIEAEEFARCFEKGENETEKKIGDGFYQHYLPLMTAQQTDLEVIKEYERISNEVNAVFLQKYLDDKFGPGVLDSYAKSYLERYSSIFKEGELITADFEAECSWMRTNIGNVPHKFKGADQNIYQGIKSATALCYMATADAIVQTSLLSTEQVDLAIDYYEEAAKLDSALKDSSEYAIGKISRCKPLGGACKQETGPEDILFPGPSTGWLDCNKGEQCAVEGLLS